MVKNEILKAENITRVYGKDTASETEALHPTSLSIYEGEFVAIMGPSGAGKSTLLTILSTLDEATKGRMFVQGVNTRLIDESALARFRNTSLGYISQDLSLIDYLTIEDNIGVPLYIKGVNEKKIREKVKEVASICHIENILHKLPSECSGGQIQRATVCRGLVNDPKLIIADEPTGNLDSGNSHEVLMTFSALNEKGIGIVMVTHDCHVASYSSRTIYVNDGEIKHTLVRGAMSQSEYYEQLVRLTSEDLHEILLEDE